MSSLVMWLRTNELPWIGLLVFRQKWCHTIAGAIVINKRHGSGRHRLARSAMDKNPSKIYG